MVFSYCSILCDFSFVTQATGLERTRSNLELVGTEIEECNNQFGMIDQKLDMKKKLMQQHKKELKELKALDTFEDKIRLITAKLFWLDVYKAQNVLDNCETALKTREKEFLRARDAVAEAEGNVEALDSISTMQHEIEVTEGLVAASNVETNTLTAAVTACTKEANALSTRMRALVKARTEDAARITNLDNEVLLFLLVDEFFEFFVAFVFADSGISRASNC